MRRHWLRPLWVLLALLFLLEAWLWDHLKPVVAWVVDLLPWASFKAWLKQAIARLPPYAALAVFAVPLIVLVPLKFLEVYFLAERQWFLAILVLVFAKLFGLGVTAFVFDATRDQLLQLAWFHRMYDWFMWARDWAHRQTEPIRQRIRQRIKQLAWLASPRRSARFFRRFMRLRRRAYRSRAV